MELLHADCEPQFNGHFKVEELVSNPFDPPLKKDATTEPDEPAIIDATIVEQKTRSAEMPFFAKIDVHHFDPRSLKVECDFDSLTVKGEMNNAPSREFALRYPLPHCTKPYEVAWEVEKGFLILRVRDEAHKKSIMSDHSFEEALEEVKRLAEERAEICPQYALVAGLIEAIESEPGLPFVLTTPGGFSH